MFTGIITRLGKFYSRNGSILTFDADPIFCKKLEVGISIAINGACLTVFEKPSENSFSVEIMPETQSKTMLEYLKIGEPVNLEPPATLQTFLSGHIVQGHIDGVARVKKITEQKVGHILKFSIPHHLSRYIAEKGSIAINGISLTVIESHKNNFTVGIIPYTWNHTILNTITTGDIVNIEVDILAKYMERLLRK